MSRSGGRARAADFALRGRWRWWIQMRVLLKELAAVLFVSQSHASILVCKSIEKISDGLVIFHVVWELAL